jgi:hypothetical protein
MVTELNMLYEGLTAEQYTDPATRARIAEDYDQRWLPKTTPGTHPELFDPLTPPQGWRYDPYYEIWITHTLEK